MVDAMSFTTRSAEETKKLGGILGRLLKPGDVVLLSGDLGAGKTTFAKGVAEGLGIDSEVASPTFTLIAEYEDGRIPFVHMDLYRLYEEGAPVDEELAAIGFDDYLEGRAAVLIEWPQAVMDELDDALAVHISPQPLPRIDERTFRCHALGPKSWQRLDEWVKRWLF
ncbi:tRNA (adenosine(37)-N6)-threonylcarbamoyltransferase complex ATPase subunit type 1 TsaE [Alicyclobacillus herbarius]|uniref:tRNA (adenosine(37)-N6)-threonylcarbamoyltransferase complex ATPase subunit type 1 TsaE n=1 Tax=Alicyclobacillus herbarius TaxID=122960 RepID=UPI00235378B8|nr:tRNA (adenosine(37)-N6)-threonylcarbamoyltransferase complex ATPase subunit type 1 TsaE [Alicyclobacillus herbarius]